MTLEGVRKDMKRGGTLGDWTTAHWNPDQEGDP